MTILKPISENTSNTIVKRIFEDIKISRKIEKIPNFWRTIANDPDTLDRTWNSLKQVMKEGSLSSLFKEMIYIAVSMTNSCEYCIRSHAKSAQSKGMSDEMLKELIAVVAMANETNRLVESYQVQVDDNLK
jgi:AhpD family alkylhydroperoxidase|tara:strand:+ start:514 stop:906 length:393 start_codon:yes stop_codon:yes gene_type:complete